MKKIFIFLILLFQYSIYCSQNRNIDTIDIPEVNLSENSNSNFLKFTETLKNTKLYSTKKASFNGVYNRNKNTFPFSGNIENHINSGSLSIFFEKKIDNDSIKGTIKKAIGAFIEVGNYYYNIISKKKNREILSDFYCIDKGDNLWFFQAIKKDLKKVIKADTNTKANFFVKLDQSGKISYIKSTLKHDDLNDQSKSNLNDHIFILYFAPYVDGIKISKSNIEIFNNYTKNSLQIDMNFID